LPTLISAQYAVRRKVGFMEDVYKSLFVWKKAHALTLGVYKVSQSFPREELYGYTSQIRRAALSTPTNIVEGSRRRTSADFRHFLNIARGSNEEVKYLLMVGRELGYVSELDAQTLSHLADEIGAMISKFNDKMPVYKI
jgi:four helix bundle protein